MGDEPVHQIMVHAQNSEHQTTQRAPKILETAVNTAAPRSAPSPVRHVQGGSFLTEKEYKQLWNLTTI